VLDFSLLLSAFHLFLKRKFQFTVLCGGADEIRRTFQNLPDDIRR